jgi:hypothetical protein
VQTVGTSAGFKQNGPIAPNLAPRLSDLFSAVQVHTITDCRFYREQQSLFVMGRLSMLFGVL